MDLMSRQYSRFEYIFCLAAVITRFASNFRGLFSPWFTPGLARVLILF